MKSVIVVCAAILVAGCTSSTQPQSGAPAPTQAAGHEAELAAALTGMIAGTPQDCVTQSELSTNKAYGPGVIVFTGRIGDVVYVNRPTGGCPGLDFGRALSTKNTSSQLCRGDIVTVFDPISGTQYGGCGLGQFTPYRRAQ